MKLFEEIVLTDTEIAIIKERLSDPIVVKYLKSMAQNAAMDAVMDSNRLTTESSEQYKVKNAFLHGTIGAVMDLLDIVEDNPQTVVQPSN